MYSAFLSNEILWAARIKIHVRQDQFVHLLVTGLIWQIQEEKANVFIRTQKTLGLPRRRFSEAPYFLIVHDRSISYFLIFSSSVERSIEIGMNLASGVPVEDLSQGYPEAD
jgi:hypothetical protein